MSAPSLEIERKFLVINSNYKNGITGQYYCQGYISDAAERVVRVRIAEDIAFLTIKGKGEGITRPEFEYEIPLPDARFLLDNLCLHPLIEKLRYKIHVNELTWEVDEFLGENEGLVIAEIELPSENYPITLPDWVGEEVSFDERFYNVNLIKNPYRNWRK